MTDLRESVARELEKRRCELAGHLPSDHAADTALRAVADAGPTEKMVSAAAQEIEVKLSNIYACRREGEDPSLSAQSLSEIARAAIAAALKEMGE